MATLKIGENKRIVIGHLIKDAEYAKVGANDKDRTNVTVSYGRDKGDIVKCTLWGALAVAASVLKKNDCIIVSGEVKSHEHNGKTYYEVSAEDAVWSQIVYVSVGTGEIDVSGFEEIKPDDIPF